MNYKNAFKCKKCPQSNNENGCPMWWEIIETNTETGKERVRKACGYILMPLFLTEVIKASNRPAAAIEATRNALVESLTRLSNNFVSVQQLEKANGQDQDIT